MSNSVIALFYSNSTLRGLFENEELAKARIVEDALSGRSVSGAHLQTLTVEGPTNPRDASQYADVVQELINGRKIQAIKLMREKIAGMGLKEAKDAVEAVDLLSLPESVRSAVTTVLPFPEPVRSMTWSHYLTDNDQDIWVHVGNGEYSLVNLDRTLSAHWNARGYSVVRDNYGLRRESDVLDLTDKYKN